MTPKSSPVLNRHGGQGSKAAQAALAAAIATTAPLVAHAQELRTYPADSGMVIQITQFDTTLNFEEMVKRTRDQFPELLATRGLIQTYYLKLEEPGRYGAIHIWENAEALTAFRSGEISTNLGSYFHLAGPPDVQVMPSVFQMRDTVVRE